MPAAWLKALGAAFGYEVVSRRKSAALLPQLETLLRFAQPDLAIDVGAHQGGFARALRAAGFKGRILSFEPGAEAFATLAAATAADPAWRAYRLAIGARRGEVRLHVRPGATDMASLLPAAAQLHQAFPHLAAAQTETVPLTTLDSLAEQGLFRGGTTLAQD